MGLFSDLKNKLPFLTSLTKQNGKADISVTELLPLTDYSELIKSKEYLKQFQGWTYRAVTFKATALARQELKLYKQTTLNKNEQLNWSTEPILRDLFKFNEVQTLYEARYLLHVYAGLTGMAFIWVCEGIKGGTKDFYLLNPERFTINTTVSGLPKSYTFSSSNGEEKEIPADEIIVFRLPDPENWLSGKSPVQASAYAVNSWEYAMKLNMNTFANQGKMQGILAFEGIGKEERKRLERTLRLKYQGSENAGKTMITGVVPTWLPITNNLHDLEYIEGIKLMRDEILSIHGVPSVLVNADGTYQNTREAERLFAKYTIDPLLELESQMYTEQLLPLYYGKDSIESKKMWFEFESAIQTDPKERAETSKIMIEAGFITINEARGMNNLDSLPDGDTLKRSESTVNAAEDVKRLKKSSKKVEKETIEIEIDSREQLKSLLLEKTINNENKFLKEINQFFNKQLERALESIKSKNKNLDFTLGLETTGEIALTINALQDVYIELGIIFNDQANELLSENVGLNSTAKKTLTKNLEYFAKEITETTIDDLNELIIFAMENGEGLESLKEEIKKLFDNYNKIEGAGGVQKLSRSETIARTETSKIKNSISYNRYKASNKVDGFEWLATGGKQSRSSHNSLDGTVRGRNELFKLNGSTCKYPHDPSLPASEVINCRCDILPVLRKDYQ